MQTQQVKLFRELEAHGWRMVEDERAEYTSDWWADEIWVLESLWHPRSCRVYLTFVVDPQWEGPRAKRESVWAVTAALKEPAQRSRVQLPLGRGWKNELPCFFAGLALLRAEWPKENGGHAEPLDPYVSPIFVDQHV